MKHLVKIAFVLVALFAVNGVQAQVCDSIAGICDRHMTNDFISDGQVYRALVHDDEVAEFHTTFFGGSTYRIAACSGFDDGNLIFTLYDNQRNELFNSSDFDNTAYWDFEIESTIDCIIEARLDPNRSSSGCAVLLIGFK